MPRIVSYNVRHCRGMDGIVSPARIAQVIAGCRADIVALQELDVRRARSSGIDQALAIAHELKMSAHFHPALRVLEELYGDAIMTARPSRLVKAGPLPTLRGLEGLEPRGALWTVVEMDGKELQVINTHLGLLPQERAAQTGALVGPEWLGHPSFCDPALLAGDLNALPWGRSFRRLSRALAGGPAPRRTKAIPPTFPSRYPVLALDHVIPSASIQIEHAFVADSPLARSASDHLPLIVDFSFCASSGEGAAADRSTNANSFLKDL